jgi:uncharacterized protein (TIGR02996 family)
MERVIVENPDDLDAYLVYADWLKAQGDLRGELIAVQVALARDPSSPGMREREAALLATPDADWANAVHSKLELTWRFGFVAGVEAWSFRDRHSLTQLFSSQTGRLVRTLRLNGDHAASLEACIVAMPPSLRELDLGPSWYRPTRDSEGYIVEENQWEPWAVDLGNLSEVWHAAPRLEKLVLRGMPRSLGEIHAPNLRHFEVSGLGYGDSLAAIQNAQWPNLETLVFNLYSNHANAAINIRSVLDDTKRLSRLKYLGLIWCHFLDDLCAVVCESKLLPQLETLDFLEGRLSAVGAHVLHNHAPALRHLKRINLDGIFLEPEDWLLVSDLCPDVHLPEMFRS